MTLTADRFSILLFHFFLFQNVLLPSITCIFSGQGVDPPPLADTPVNYAIFKYQKSLFLIMQIQNRTEQNIIMATWKLELSPSNITRFFIG